MHAFKLIWVIKQYSEISYFGLKDTFQEPIYVLCLIYINITANSNSTSHMEDGLIRLPAQIAVLNTLLFHMTPHGFIWTK